MTAPGSGPDVDDLVGPRVLAGIQMINISRLSTHPVPITSRGLITVAGQGPSDSNGAGKSSFIAGLSLLHADDQWRLQSGAQAAAELLFTAELAGQESLHANADRGYIVGVFVPPGAHCVAELEADTLTVWLRINRQAPHLELRWAPHLHVAYGDTENERAGGADRLWDELPRSNGRTDIRANRLARTLYGGTVRCVSFLSTSVRASLTANLLAQPLNELSPERIFAAVGALTGLNREIDDEQQARQQEHQHAVDAQQARQEYAQWSDRMAVVEDAVRSREQARTLLAEARDSWTSRCARHLVDGVARDADLAAELDRLAARRDELDEQIETAAGDLARLADDATFEASYRRRVAEHEEALAAAQDLRTQQSHHIGQLEQLTARIRTLRAAADAADGRTLAEAETELRDATAAIRDAERHKGVTQQAVTRARAALAAAERGEDVADPQVRALRAAGITGVPLVDAISLTEEQRPVWEARLLPYRHAVVVADAAPAVKVLADVPGSLVVEADPPGLPAGAGLPAAADPALTVHRFLGVLRDRAGDAAADLDTAAGVHGTAGFGEAITGRAGRIHAAREALHRAALADEAADDGIRRARGDRDRSGEHVRAARAAIEAGALDGQVAELRARNARIGEALESLAARLAASRAGYEAALGERNARDQRITAARAQRDALRREREHEHASWLLTAGERATLDLPGRHDAWQGTVASAERHLLTLGEREQKRSTAEWDDLCAYQADRAREACFPADTPAEQIPEELQVVDERRRDRRSGAHLRLVPQVLRIVGAYLDELAEIDEQTLDQIHTERAVRTQTLHSAETHLHEAQLASAALRATLATAIKAKLRRVAAEFDQLDQAYGGYGAGLDFPEPEPPADPQKPWQWTITPRWRRGEGKPLSSYRLRGNTAQMDDKAVKLVCAAALAGSHDRPLLLVLDELGRNLGAAHRRDAVALFENIGRDRAISVVGALQDDMERYAIGASSLYIKLRRTSDAFPYNQAPVVVGSEAESARIALLAEWMTSYRPPPPT
ncbi:coiled-coil domain-containing protein [Couchioplanes azureus]|uniref:hypothetical protein n=1 Tax=Couchioplanes caeruleus TaxID=56438 RepID=UPI00166F994D|nr:hypothetical protein [Couchioplanes caeruleus]GGQ49653.1 hypothetical protein GCM10010166_17630 [Couchioplanes caeruleus subsp. azureus]